MSYKKIKYNYLKLYNRDFINKLLGILLILIPCSYIIGPAVTEFFVLLGIIHFFTINPLKKSKIFNDPIIIFLFLFSLYIFVNSYFQITGKGSANLRLSSWFHFRFVFFAISVFFICKILENYKRNYIFLFLVFFLLILTIDSIFQFFYGFNIVGLDIARHYRVSSFFSDELILGSYIVRLLPIVLWSIFFFNIDLNKNFFLLILLFSSSIISIFLSGERTSFFLCLVIIILSLLLLKNLRNILFISVAIFSLFIFFIFYSKAGSYDPFNRMFIKTFNQITEKRVILNNDEIIKNNNNSKNFRIFSKDHEGHINLAFELFSENKIFGIGPKGFRFYCRKVNYDPPTGVCSTHPHNIIVQIISELGLIGFIFYLIAAFFFLINFVKTFLEKKVNNKYLAFYSITLGIIVNLFPFLPSGNFFNNWISIILYYNIGIYLYSYNEVDR